MVELRSLPRFLCIALLLCNQTFAAKFFKITYTTTKQSESIETIINQFVARRGVKGGAEKEVVTNLIQDTTERNPHISNWKKIPIGSTLTILVSEDFMNNEEIKFFIAVEEKKRQEKEDKEQKLLNSVKDDFLSVDSKLQRHSLFVSYFFENIQETNGIYVVHSNFAPFLNFGHEYTYLHNFNKWKVEKLLYHTIINLHQAEKINNIKIPLAYSLQSEIIFHNTFKEFSPYLALKYNVSPNITGDQTGFVMRVTKNLSTGLGLSYQYYFKAIKIMACTDYLMDIVSNSKTRDSVVGGIRGNELDVKLRFAYAHQVGLIDSWFIESIYATTSRDSSTKEIVISSNRFAVNFGFSF
ncbi:MAG: hypothetical protein A2504_12390 [Bdellovibrionales bacterium RIFOXYD12_FULL_39_22]|nr:MAG: hypothetical protein A2385_17925 [Bdellovibrionales bacterium RIFOXYB1_FULL_39_21]OFZ40706.1 MAG: hypothetical protein A2485_03700 [Bdellovibrionales bacterium RIFOXYC12_FULL_39_17]OFZ49747.1 MAG: hypothetical protein A2404_00055 [Bdellovibrionales bacterium RIFOXYC1_FULL_39_130]OFZ77277.1 MAG: hypothetical protein A2560_14865 [Bdellovibrionales bacterium RIFOXYD1_FULL_39_84]OFZ91828.1 MAG: hypothetical protein A2504_12390 [Bdellovibrionales bacterium RIFOXYD12_FULL_39_22]